MSEREAALLVLRSGSAHIVWETYDEVRGLLDQAEARNGLIDLHPVEDADYTLSIRPSVVEIVRPSVRPYHLQGLDRPVEATA